jgi:RimJ/RimL family protein N-acetyltransferase
MCADPALIVTLGGPPTLSESRDVAERQNHLLETTGSCFWAMELRDTGRFIGWCGVKPGAAGTPIAAEREIGWSLASAHWGRGYAHEAAVATLAWTWANLNVASVAAITTPDNHRSRGLMERLGMTRYPDEDFDHPDLAPGDPLRRHVVYRIARPRQ